MKAYQEYKETGLDWLGAVPKHWGLLRAKNLYKKENRLPLENDEVVTCFRDGQVTLRKNRRQKGFTEAIQEHGYQHIKKGDLVIHVMDAFAGAIGVSDSNGKGTPVYSVCTAKQDLNNFYYAHIVREMAYKGYIQSLYRGIRERSSDFRFEVFAQQILPIPPREEQDQIVKFLDYKISKINKFIKNKKRLIELLNEQKQAVINQAVTKGLNPNVEMKDSGIDWLGEVPKHWNKNYLFQVAKEQYFSNKGLINENLLSLSYGNIINKNINTTDGLLPVSFETYQIIHGGNIVLRLTDLQNDRKSLRVGLSIQTGIITSAYICLAPQKNILPEYLYFYLHSFDVCKGFYGMGAGVRQGLTYKNISKSEVLLPLCEEQTKIVDFIKKEILIFGLATSQIQKEIDLIQEYKTSLISSVVTGQVDVRDAIVPHFTSEEIFDIDESIKNFESEE